MLIRSAVCRIKLFGPNSWIRGMAAAELSTNVAPLPNSDVTPNCDATAVPIVEEETSVKRRADDLNDPDYLAKVTNRRLSNLVAFDLFNIRDILTFKRSRREVEAKTEHKTRGKRKKFAMLCSYVGQKFYGMQINPNVPTVERELFNAFRSLDMITDDERKTPYLFWFQRAARTDKGVSAVKQICSLKLKMADSECGEIIPKINQLLPEDIRVVGMKRATKGFCAKNWCDARTYSYTLPTYAFSHLDEKSDKDFRLSDERRSEVNELLSLYLGTHNFFNFTSGKDFADKRCCRYIISCECSAPFIHGDVEFTTIYLKGQSFLLHQIRKMVGLIIGVVRGLTNKSTIQKAFEHQRVDIPKAPGLGLVLENVHYDKYNKKYSATHDKIVWDEFEESLNKFRDERIRRQIFEAEVNSSPESMFQWLSTLPLHTYEDSNEGKVEGEASQAEGLRKSKKLADEADGVNCDSD